MIAVEDRLSLLEKRLSHLEHALLQSDLKNSASPERTSAVAASAIDSDVDPYFALTALKRLLPAPGGVVYAGAVDLPGDRRAEWQYGLATDVILDEEWAARAETMAALGHPVRMQLVQEVLIGMASVAELSAIEGLGTSGQVYHHLRTLVTAGWLQSTSRGRYEVPTARIVPLLVMILAARR